MNAAATLFDESHQQLREQARRFVAREISPHIDSWEEAGSFPRDLYQRTAAAGLLGIGYPEQWGGCGGDIVHKTVWTEELMRAGSGGLAASLGSLDISLPLVLEFASDQLQQRVAPPVLAGDKICALAITEPGAGSDVAAIATKAELVSVDGSDYYRLNGSKTYITSGCRADFFVVAVRTGGAGHAGISLVLVEAERDGFSRSAPLKKMGWWASDTAELAFNDCLIPAANLIGQAGGGFKMIAHNFQAERLNLATMAVVTAELALAAGLEQANSRHAFGGTLANHQTVRHKLADMATEVTVAQSFVHHCAARMAAGESIAKEVSMAKNFACDVSDRATFNAVQLHGGMGYMRGVLVERLYRDNRILSIGGGAREIMNEIIAKQLGLPG